MGKATGAAADRFVLIRRPAGAAVEMCAQQRLAGFEADAGPPARGASPGRPPPAGAALHLPSGRAPAAGPIAIRSVAHAIAVDMVIASQTGRWKRRCSPVKRPSKPRRSTSRKASRPQNSPPQEIPTNMGEMLDRPGSGGDSPERRKLLALRVSPRRLGPGFCAPRPGIRSSYGQSSAYSLMAAEAAVPTVAPRERLADRR